MRTRRFEADQQPMRVDGGFADNAGVGSWIGRRRRAAPNRTALVFAGRSWTYAQLDDRVNRLAGALVRLGVKRGDRVGYLGTNHPAFLELLFAAGCIGAIPVPINTRLAHEDIVFIVRDAGCDVLIHTHNVSELLTPLRATTRVRTYVAVGDVEGNSAGYEQVLAAEPTNRVDVAVSDGDIALMVYTSGTTGRPKGVMLTHGNLTWNAVNFLVAGDFRADDVSLAIMPFFRVGGLAVTLLETLLVGGTVVLMADFDAGRALELIEQHKITTLFGGPALLQALEEDPSFPSTDFRASGSVTRVEPRCRSDSCASTWNGEYPYCRDTG